MKFEKIKVGHVCLAIGLIILLTPPLFSLKAFCSFFAINGNGEIGDIIGGVTSPFINGIGAILVFIAFKEQVKANKLITEQQYFHHIQEQIHRLEDDIYDLPTLIDKIWDNIVASEKDAKNFTEDKQTTYYVNTAYLNKAIYLLAVFRQTVELIDKMESDKKFMKIKLITIYKIIYQDYYVVLAKYLNTTTHMKSNADKYILQILKEIKDLETMLGESSEWAAC